MSNDEQNYDEAVYSDDSEYEHHDSVLSTGQRNSLPNRQSKRLSYGRKRNDSNVEQVLNKKEQQYKIHQTQSRILSELISTNQQQPKQPEEGESQTMVSYGLNGGQNKDNDSGSMEQSNTNFSEMLVSMNESQNQSEVFDVMEMSLSKKTPYEEVEPRQQLHQQQPHTVQESQIQVQEAIQKIQKVVMKDQAIDYLPEQPYTQAQQQSITAEKGLQINQNMEPQQEGTQRQAGKNQQKQRQGQQQQIKQAQNGQEFRQRSLSDNSEKQRVSSDVVANQVDDDGNQQHGHSLGQEFNIQNEGQEDEKILQSFRDSTEEKRRNRLPGNSQLEYPEQNDYYTGNSELTPLDSQIKISQQNDIHQHQHQDPHQQLQSTQIDIQVTYEQSDPHQQQHQNQDQKFNQHQPQQQPQHQHLPQQQPQYQHQPQSQTQNLQQHQPQQQTQKLQQQQPSEQQPQRQSPQQLSEPTQVIQSQEEQENSVPQTQPQQPTITTQDLDALQQEPHDQQNTQHLTQEQPQQQFPSNTNNFEEKPLQEELFSTYNHQQVQVQPHQEETPQMIPAQYQEVNEYALQQAEEQTHQVSQQPIQNREQLQGEIQQQSPAIQYQLTQELRQQQRQQLRQELKQQQEVRGEQSANQKGIEVFHGAQQSQAQQRAQVQLQVQEVDNEQQEQWPATYGHSQQEPVSALQNHQHVQAQSIISQPRQQESQNQSNNQPLNQALDCRVNPDEEPNSLQQQPNQTISNILPPSLIQPSQNTGSLSIDQSEANQQPNHQQLINQDSSAFHNPSGTHVHSKNSNPSQIVQTQIYTANQKQMTDLPIQQSISHNVPKRNGYQPPQQTPPIVRHIDSLVRQQPEENRQVQSQFIKIQQDNDSYLQNQSDIRYVQSDVPSNPVHSQRPKPQYAQPAILTKVESSQLSSPIRKGPQIKRNQLEASQYFVVDKNLSSLDIYGRSEYNQLVQPIQTIPERPNEERQSLPMNSSKGQLMEEAQQHKEPERVKQRQSVPKVVSQAEQKKAGSKFQEGEEDLRGSVSKADMIMSTSQMQNPKKVKKQKAGSSHKAAGQNPESCKCQIF